jgi:hypothetical protein
MLISCKHDKNVYFLKCEGSTANNLCPAKQTIHPIHHNFTYSIKKTELKQDILTTSIFVKKKTGINRLFNKWVIIKP